MTRTLHTLLQSGVTVLTASRRLAYALRLDFAQREQQAGKSVWRSPRVLPWSTWLREQWLETRTQVTSADNASPVLLLNNAQSRILWDEVVHASEQAQQLLSPSRAARIAARSWQRLHEYCIDIDALASSDSVETQAFVSWSREFRRRCDAIGAVDEARLAHLAQRTRFVPTQTVAFAGFDALPPVLVQLSNWWQQHDRLVTPDEVARVDTDHVRKVAAADPEQELELAARWARNQVEAGAVSIGVVISALQDRRHDVRRVFADVFAPAARRVGEDDASLPVVIAAPEPLTEYPLVADALALLQLGNSGADSLLIGRLLRSPFIIGGESERHLRALADVRLRDEQRNEWSWADLERWAELTGCRQLQLAAREVVTLLRTDRTVATASSWSERFVRVLRALQWPGERTQSSIEHQTVTKFQEVLAQFGTLDGVLGPITRVVALQRLKELTQETAFEAQSGPASVTVIDPATVAGMRFDALWIAGLEATQLPAATSPDPFLPLDVQRDAGIPEASARAMLLLGQRQLQRLITSARDVTVSWPERDGDAELQPSPLLAPFILHASASSQRTPLLALRQSLFDQRPRLESLADHFAPQVHAAAARGGAMIIELQSRCAFRAQAQLRLDAQAMPVVSLGIEPRERGNLLHQVLEVLWNELGSQQALLQLSDDDLARLLRAVTERAAAATLLPANRMQTRLMALEVDAIVMQLQVLMNIERARPPFSVHRAEKSESFALQGLSIRLKPDRIDRLASGGDLLIDYKLGDSHQPRQWLDASPGRPRRPQLPLYALAHSDSVQALAFVVAAPGTVEYRGWSSGAFVADGVAPYPPRRPRFGEPADWNALLDHWRRVVNDLASSYIAGVATVDPLPQECTYCHLRTLCRVHEAQLQAEAGLDDE